MAVHVHTPCTTQLLETPEAIKQYDVWYHACSQDIHVYLRDEKLQHQCENELISGSYNACYNLHDCSAARRSIVGATLDCCVQRRS